jgi:hypothetical protein
MVTWVGWVGRFPFAGEKIQSLAVQKTRFPVA